MPVFRKTYFHTLSKSNEDTTIDTAIGDIKGFEWNVLGNAHLAEVNVVFNIVMCFSSSTRKCSQLNSVMEWIDKIYRDSLLKAIYMRNGSLWNRIHEMVDRLQWKYSGTVQATDKEIFDCIRVPDQYFKVMDCNKK